MIEELLKKNKAFEMAIDELTRWTSFGDFSFYMILDILTDISKIVDVDNEGPLNVNLDESGANKYQKISSSLHRIREQLKSRIKKFKKRSEDLGTELMCMEMGYRSELNKSMDKDVQIAALEKMVKDVETSKVLLQNKMLEEKTKMKKNFDWVMDQRKIIYDKEVDRLTTEIAKQQKTIDELTEMQVRRDNIALLTEQKAQIKKELEDMEDTLSRDIKTLQGRKIFIHSMQNRLKKPNEVNDTQKIVEQGYSNTMAGITALRNDIGKLQDSLRQANAGC